MASARLVAALLAALIATVVTVMSDKEGIRSMCRSSGFDIDTLLCGTCSKLQDITSTSLGTTCLKCCSSPFDTAKLEVSQMSLMRSVGINDFLNNRRSMFGRAVDFDMIPVHEEHAELIMRRDGKTLMVHKIAQWSVNDIEDYIAQYLPKISK